jgi:WhiB family redox-sensing transcriptional regulator
MPAHGTRSCYINNKCRHPSCVEANRAYIANRRHVIATAEPGTLPEPLNDVDRLFANLRQVIIDQQDPWRLHAACRGLNPTLFMSTNPADVASAADICSACPALSRCATYADQHAEKIGVWGGDDRSPKTRELTVAEV